MDQVKGILEEKGYDKNNTKFLGVVDCVAYYCSEGHILIGDYGDDHTSLGNIHEIVSKNIDQFEYESERYIWRRCKHILACLRKLGYVMVGEDLYTRSLRRKV